VRDASSVNKRSIRRIQIAQKGTRRIYFEQTVVAREIAIVRQEKMGVAATSDQKAVVLSEGKDAALVRAGGDFQIDLHFSVEPEKAQEAQVSRLLS
jgi:hypothetical protein